MRKHTIALAITAALAATSFTTAQAASWKAGDWDLSLGGNVNTYYNVTTCDTDKLKSGGTKPKATMASLACFDADTGSFNGSNTHSVSNGLLPASLNFSAKTNQNGYDVSGNVNVYYGVDSQEANAFAGDALEFSTVDARQVYLTFGNDKMGTVKAGRDFGLFGFDSVIGDMSLQGTGAMFTSAGPGHTTLGGLGYGYVYTDRLAQMNWTTPKTKSGVSATVGVFNPVDGQQSAGGVGLFDGGIPVSTGDAGQPGFHGKLSYDWDKGNGVKGHVSTSGLSQKVKLASGKESEIQGIDVYGKVDVNNLGLAASAYQGKGMDTLGLGGIIYPGFDSTSGEAEKAKGYMAQASYKINKTKLGVNYSQSEQTKLNKVKNNRVTLGAYHSLTDNLTLVGEVSDQKSKIAGNSDKSGSVSVGAMFSF